MKTEWDYTDLADAYLKRPDYSNDAIEKMFSIAGIKKGDKVCDVGAGAAHLTLELAEAQFNVCAVEPNDASLSIFSESAESKKPSLFKNLILSSIHFLCSEKRYGSFLSSRNIFALSGLSRMASYKSTPNSPDS